MSAAGRFDKDEDLQTDAVPAQPRRGVIKNEINIEGLENTTDTNAIHANASKPMEVLSAAESTTAPSTAEGESERECTKPTKDKKKKSSSKGDFKNVPPPQAVVYNIKKSTGVHIGNNVVIQCRPHSSSAPPSAAAVKVTKEIEKVLQSSEPVKLEDLNLVSSHIGTNWMEVGRHLKYTDGQLEQFYEDNGRKGLKEVVYRMLLDWKQVNTSKATVGLLCNALWTSKQYDAVEALGMKTSKKKS